MRAMCPPKDKLFCTCTMLNFPPTRRHTRIKTTTTLDFFMINTDDQSLQNVNSRELETSDLLNTCSCELYGFVVHNLKKKSIFFLSTSLGFNAIFQIVHNGIQLEDTLCVYCCSTLWALLAGYKSNADQVAFCECYKFCQIIFHARFGI